MFFIRILDLCSVPRGSFVGMESPWLLMQSRRCYMFFHVGVKPPGIGVGGGGPLMSEVTKSLHKLSHVKREHSVLEGQEETAMRQPCYHELFPGGYEVNPSDLANSVSLTRLPHDNRLNTAAKNSVWCLDIIVP